jgi:hypothetical protein
VFEAHTDETLATVTSGRFDAITPTLIVGYGLMALRLRPGYALPAHLTSL